MSAPVQEKPRAARAKQGRRVKARRGEAELEVIVPVSRGTVTQRSRRRREKQGRGLIGLFVSTITGSPAPATSAEGVAVAARPGQRGWSGPAAGSVTGVASPPMWRGTSVQVCGLWPWVAGAGSPMTGVPLGRNILTGATVCCDPISWFKRARLISSPSVFVLGKVGLGKSSLIRRMQLGLNGYGVIPLVLGDTKPDHADLVAAMGGAVFRLGRGRGHINPLDRTLELEAAERLKQVPFVDVGGVEVAGSTLASQLLADAHGRRLTMVLALLAIARKGPANDREENVLSRAIELVDRANPGGEPVLRDLLEVIKAAPAELREVALDRGSLDRYKELTESLEASLVGLASGTGRLGDLFSEKSSVRMELARPVNFDISAIEETDTDLLAAASLVCWATGAGGVSVANKLSDAGLEPQRHYFIVMDEFWKTLGAAPGLVRLVDGLLRLIRTLGVGAAMISHTLADLEAIADPVDRAKAMGFVERAGMVISGGVPRAEMPRLRMVLDLSQAEEDMLASWSSPPAWDQHSTSEPPGRGKFLVKVGGRPGIPFQVVLTPSEKDVNDTNQRWHSPAV